MAGGLLPLPARLLPPPEPYTTCTAADSEVYEEQGFAFSGGLERDALPGAEEVGWRRHVHFPPSLPKVRKLLPLAYTRG